MAAQSVCIYIYNILCVPPALQNNIYTTKDFAQPPNLIQMPMTLIFIKASKGRCV